MKKPFLLLLVISLFVLSCSKTSFKTLGEKRNYQQKVESAKQQNKVVGPLQGSALEWNEKSYQSLMANQWTEAIRTSSAAITINPNLVSAYINRSWAYIEKGLYSEAIEDCNKAIQIENNNPAAFNNRGLAYSKLGEHEKATMDYRKACEMDFKIACNNFKEKTGYFLSEEGEFLQNQAIESFSSGDFDQVIIATGKLIELDPNNADAYSMRCEAKAYKGLIHAAKKDCKKSIEFNPNFSMAYNNLGYVLELDGNEVQAIIYYEMSCGMGNKMGCQNRQRLYSFSK